MNFPAVQLFALVLVNDHILIVLADRPGGDAKLNVEGTDLLLIIMPEIERTPGSVDCLSRSHQSSGRGRAPHTS